MIFEKKSYHLREHFVAVLLIPNMTILLLYIVILNIYSEQFAIKKNENASDQKKKNSAGMLTYT